MSTASAGLHALQRRLCCAVLGGDSAAIADLIQSVESGGVGPAARLRIYRNHAFSTLGAALKAVFPIVCRLVDERFFAYAVEQYIRDCPPRSRCLGEYGSDFPAFLARFEPCRRLFYLADVGRLEWALNAAAKEGEAPSLPLDRLEAIPVLRAGYLRFSLQRSVRYFASAWPVDDVWQANQHSEVPSIDLTMGGIMLEIRRAGMNVVWRRLDAGTFAFRWALANRHVFAAAIAAASAKDPRFDAASALPRVLAEGLAVDFDFAAGPPDA